MTGTSAGLLGDTIARDYSRKLQLFNTFAEPEPPRAAASRRADFHFLQTFTLAVAEVP